MKIFKATFQYPIGIINFYSNNDYLLAILINKEKNLNMYNDELILYENEIIYEARKQLDGYFKGILQEFNLPLYIEGTDKEKKVFNELKDKVSFGSFTSYSEFADLVGFKKGARFIGNVLSKNQIQIIIPCHRVIKKDGTLGGFNSGVSIKRKLINLEKELKNEIIH